VFDPAQILYEDNHLLVVNKRAGELVQPDPSGGAALENDIKDFIKVRDAKPGEVFLGVVHRIDRPVSGAVVFAKTSKALVRLNEMIKARRIEKTYWAIVERAPEQSGALLVHHIVRNAKNNTSRAYNATTPESKEARLQYKLLASSDRYHLLEVALLTGRHHQIRAQLSAIGCPIKGDLKYGAARSNSGGGICLHSRRLRFAHPVTPPTAPGAVAAPREVDVTAPVPEDKLWTYFEENA
jgi:23S rRNA pseudouridine1911/1915/1917 synthase